SGSLTVAGASVWTTCGGDFGAALWRLTVLEGACCFAGGVVCSMAETICWPAFGELFARVIPSDEEASSRLFLRSSSIAVFLSPLQAARRTAPAPASNKKLFRIENSFPITGKWPIQLHRSETADSVRRTYKGN